MEYPDGGGSCHRPGTARGSAGSWGRRQVGALPQMRAVNSRNVLKLETLIFSFFMSMVRKMDIFLKNRCPDLWHERLHGGRNHIKQSQLEEWVESRVGIHREALDKFIVICPEPSPGRPQVCGFGLEKNIWADI